MDGEAELGQETGDQLYFQMNLDHLVRLLSRLVYLEFYEEYAFAHLNESVGHAYLALSLASICHFDPRSALGLRLYGC